MAGQHQLFDDTSAVPGPPGMEYHNHGSPALGIPTQAFLSEPMSNFAMAYGSSLATQGKEMVDKNIDRIIPVNKLKYYFAVDTVYVGKKIGLLLFPYMHQVSRGSRRELCPLFAFHIVLLSLMMQECDLCRI
ncbi:hypothetical protein GDO81_025245 [Engystomops pustulosus]|uniref:Protein YIF1 n=1 Tax=Engystomops pustulosus TaxID=76066 RepID=A0AAV6YP19_ENGPU|nr:hypothetical protein GDO81_025245 [Engystomops pustulosus]